MTDTLTGRALDRRVADAMGAIIHDTGYGHIFIWPKGMEYIGDSLPPFSADTPAGREAMWGLIEIMAENGWLWNGGHWTGKHRFRVTFTRDLSKPFEIEEVQADASSLPAATAIAALAAMGVGDA